MVLRGRHNFFVTLVAVAVVGASLAACKGLETAGGADQNVNSDAIVVDKQTPQVEVRVLTAADIQSQLLAGRKSAKQTIDADAFTQWFYGCTVDFETENVFEDATPMASSTAVKIKGVRFKLALPIVEVLPPDCDKALRDHESGHVRICSLVYGEAGAACQKAGREVLGRKFNGMGKDLATAKEMALGQARRIVATVFHQNVSSKADQASELYDRLCRVHRFDPKLDSLALANMAFNDVKAKQGRILK